MEFMTEAEKAQLEQQLAELVGKRKALSDRIGAARELGDLRENADYHAAREDQGMNEAKIRELEKRLKNSQVADPDAIPDDVVFVGATVKLRDTDTGEEDLYKLVGESTGNFMLDYIEVTPNSPMGQALMKARVGETVRADLPKGTKRFEIVEIVE
ncbi:MAG: transcription elongation factor GreA [Planctomycetes bacterium]|nr:transcription elongation factor GreA [Planctomycetota bacterium]NOG54629.1 transcription elongation factor GreA [Planctomycetota bacterium]